MTCKECEKACEGVEFKRVRPTLPVYVTIGCPCLCHELEEPPK